jgi:hypothetical protein
MATSNQKRLWMNRSNQSSEKPKIGGISGNPPAKIVDPGASWRRLFCAITTMKAVMSPIFLFGALNPGVRASDRGLGQTLTKSPAF